MIAGPVLRSGGFSVEALLWNLAGLASLSAWSAIGSALIFGFLKACGILRVSERVEEQGIDAATHGDCSYPECE